MDSDLGALLNQTKLVIGKKNDSLSIHLFILMIKSKKRPKSAQNRFFKKSSFL